MRACKKCSQENPEEEFYSGDSKCKPCRRGMVRANRAKNAEYYRAYDRVRFSNQGCRGEASTEAKRNAKVAWISRNAEKRSAHVAVGNALRSGKLVNPGKCSECDQTRSIQAHHDDYSKPLVVRWLCVSCHSGHHRGHDIDADRLLIATRR